MGSVLKIDHKNFMPGGEIDAAYAAPRNFSGWAGHYEGKSA